MLPLLLIPYYILVGAAGAYFINKQTKSGDSSQYKIVGFNPDYAWIKGQDLMKDYGIKVKKELPLINACLCEVTEKAVVQNLAEDPMIEFIEDDIEGAIQVMPTFTLDIKEQGQEIPWGIKRVGAPDVWKNTRGEGIRVGIIDTGVDTNHPDLKDNIASAGWVLECQNIVDDNGHGTHVAGTIAAVDNKIGVIGVAPKVKIYAVKAFTKSGRGKISDVIEGLNWCVENKVHVINMSFGFKNNKALEKAIKAVYKRGIVLVAASGNSGGSNNVMYPARYPEVIAVAASNSSDKVAWFSSGGPQVDVIAPGAGILSTYKNGAYKTMSGTSMACPHVAAACAIILSKSKVSPKEVKNILINTSRDLGFAKTKQGSGLINVSQAIQSI